MCRCRCIDVDVDVEVNIEVDVDVFVHVDEDLMYKKDVEKKAVQGVNNNYVYIAYIGV